MKFRAVIADGVALLVSAGTISIGVPQTLPLGLFGWRNGMQGR